MKKISALCLAILIMAFNALSVFAGDIPESLLSDDEAKVFYGVLVEANPFGESFNATVKPVKKLKGDVVLDVDANYEKLGFILSFTPKRGNVYLFAYLNEDNPLYIFDIDSYDTATVNIRGAENNEMWQRFEKYVNEGKFEEAEKARLEKAGIEETKWQIDELPGLKSFSMEIYALLSIGVGVIAFLIYTRFSKKKL